LIDGAFGLDKNKDTPKRRVFIYGRGRALPSISTIIYVCILKMSPSRILIVLLISLEKCPKSNKRPGAKSVKEMNRRMN